jgi:CheY-like chemotaxis protein
VLIVDDLPENRLTLGLCCEQFGLFHECVENGREAVEAAQSGRFDVILMDIFMPRMDGMAATRAIRALSGPIAAIPIVAVTPAAAPGEVLRYLACGMTDVVPKPISLARLAEALSAAFAQVGGETAGEPIPQRSARLTA